MDNGTYTFVTSDSIGGRVVVSIDLRRFADALRPYLEHPTAPEKCGICNHEGPRIYKGQEPHSCVGRLVEQAKPKDPVEEAISAIISAMAYPDSDKLLRELLHELASIAAKQAVNDYKSLCNGDFS